MPDIRFHDLRHTCAILLFTQGVHPKIVSEMIGHANISITLDAYSHVIPGLGEATASEMEDALIPSPGEGRCVSRRHEPPPLTITAPKDVDSRFRGNDGSGHLSYGDQADLV